MNEHDPLSSGSSGPNPPGPTSSGPTSSGPDSTDTARQLRQALRPTAQDDMDAQRILDRVLDGSAHPSSQSASQPASGVHPGATAWRWAAPLLAACAAGFLALTVGLAARPNSPAVPAGPAVIADRPSQPEVLTVTCAPNGVTIDRSQVAAAPDGVHVRISNTGRTPVTPFLRPGDESWLPGSSWEPVHPGKTSERVLPLPPGRNTVACDLTSSSGNQVLTVATPHQVFTVQDPSRSWQGSPAEAGCALGGIASWVGGPGRGVTPELAVLAFPGSGLTPAQHADMQRGRTAEPFRAGYVDARPQLWLVRRHGVPQHLMLVRALPAGGYEAEPDWVCAESFPSAQRTSPTSAR